MLAQRLRQLPEQVARAAVQRAVEEVQDPRHLLGHGRLAQADLAGHPQQVDLVADAAGHACALALGVAGLLQLLEQHVDAPVDLQHRHPLGLGRVRGQHRRDPRRGQPRRHRPRVQARRLGARQRRRERARHPRRAELALDRPPPPDGGVLLGDVEQLEPDAVRLQHAQADVRGDRRLAGQHRQAFRAAFGDDLEQQAAQQPDRLRGMAQAVRADAVFGGLRGSGGSGARHGSGAAGPAGGLRRRGRSAPRRRRTGPGS